MKKSSTYQNNQKDCKKRVVIVKGGPGTGKTVVAINLLANLTSEEQFVSMFLKIVHHEVYIQKKLKVKSERAV